MSSSLKSTDFTLQLCPLKSAKQSSRLTSHSLIVWSPEAVTCSVNQSISQSASQPVNPQLVEGRLPSTDWGTKMKLESRVGTVVRALAFHQCVQFPDSASYRLSLLVLYSAPRGFSPDTSIFHSHQKAAFDLI